MEFNESVVNKYFLGVQIKLNNIFVLFSFCKLIRPNMVDIEPPADYEMVPSHMIHEVRYDASEMKPKHYQHGLLKVNLRRDQRQMVRAILKKEHLPFIEGIDKQKQKVRMYTKMGVLANPVGSGKTVIVIALVASGMFPPKSDIFDVYCQSAYSQCLQLTEIPTYKCTLIVIPNVLLKQWATSFKQMAPQLTVKIISSVKTVKNFIPTTDTHAVIVTNTMYKSFLDHIHVKPLQWARVIFDELHTCDKLSKVVPKTNFVWSLNATIFAMFSSSNTVTKMLYGNLRCNRNAGGAMLCIRNSEKALQEGMNLPHLHRAFIRCKASEQIHSSTLNVLSADQRDELHANAISLVELRQNINEKFEKEIQSFEAASARAEADLTYRQTHHFTEARIEISKTTLEKVKKRLNEKKHEHQTVLERFDNTLSENCSVCMEELLECSNQLQLPLSEEEKIKPYRCMLSCKHFVCVVCASEMERLFRGPSDTLFKCPQCRTSIKKDDPNSVQVICNTTGQAPTTAADAEVVPQQLKKTDCLIAILTHNLDVFQNISSETEKRMITQLLSPSRKQGMRFVVAAKHKKTFQLLQKKLESLSIKYETLRAGNSLPHIMERFKNGTSTVLFLKTESDGSGLDGLQYLSNDFVLILYHKLDSNIEKQTIGRLCRYAGETTMSRQVTVVALYVENEYESEYIQKVQSNW